MDYHLGRLPGDSSPLPVRFMGWAESMTRIRYRTIPDAKPIDCKGLSDYVFDLVRIKGIDSDEFKDLLKSFSKDMLRNLYKQALEKRSIVKK